MRQFRLHRPHENVVRPFHSLGVLGRKKLCLGISQDPNLGLIDRSQVIKAAEGRGGALSSAYMARFLILLLFALLFFFGFDFDF